MLYAQLNEQNICTGVSNLSNKVPEYNYILEANFDPITGETAQGDQVFSSRMVEISVYSSNYIGLKYNEGSWEIIEAVE